MSSRQESTISLAAENSTHVPEPLIRNVRSTKIQPRHLERSAIVYVRQSTPIQVLEHVESKARQYDLANHAIALGWSTGQVVIIDEDQGKSGREAENRSGFQRLLAEVTLGHVGLILGLEMSRLARSSKDWHHLLELCALFDTLLGDQDGVYNPTDSNDRLLLGLKGTMSEFELFTMRNRLQRGLVHKAERGELHIAPPLGYERLLSGEVVLDTDEQARDVIHLIFDKFDELGSARKVMIYLIKHNIQLGIRWNRGSRRGQLEWRRPQYGTVLRILTHPNYAGAYVYGRKDIRRNRPSRRTNSGELSRYRPTAWKILLKDRMPAYITWDQYETNQKRLQENIPTPTSTGAPRGGLALLAGLAVCGTCGRKLHSTYPRAGKPHYICTRHSEQIREQTCHGVTAGVIDDLVVDQVHQALKPACLALSLRAIEDGQKERARLDDHWKKKLERARYEVQRAERQYQAVEPENRLVARTLEQRWEAAMLEQRRIEEEFNRFTRDKPARLTETERARIVALSADIPSLWKSENTTNVDRKDIIRCLVEKVIVIVHQNSEFCDVTIHWKGGYTSQHEVARPVRSLSQTRDCDRLRERITELHRQGQTAAAIAATLTGEGYLSPRRRTTYSPNHVHQLIRKYGLAKQRIREELPKDEWWLPELAKALGVTNRKLRDWLIRKWCHARQASDPGGLWIVWADHRELDRLGRLKAHSELESPSYPTRLTTPTKRKPS